MGGFSTRDSRFDNIVFDRVKKTPLDPVVSLAQAKMQLNIDPSYYEEDSEAEETNWEDVYINSLINPATKFCENIISGDIREYKVEHTVKNFRGVWFRVEQNPLKSFSGICEIASDGTNIDLVEGVDYEIFENQFHFLVKFASTKSKYGFTMYYNTGYDVDDVPEELLQAILIKATDLYDPERQGYSRGVNPNKAIESLLGGYMKLL